VAEKICDNLRDKGINMLFVIGGDGTQAAGNLLFEAAKARKLALSIVGVPKSIDNDVLFFDRTFGFDSAVASATECIRNAWTEATSCDKGIGIVKLMGRDAGFVVQNAVIASTIVDLALIPEVTFKLDAVMKHLEDTVKRKNYAVVVVAEGAGQEHVATGEKDSTGHTKYGDIGTFLRDKINAHFKPLGGRSFYIDPSYIIRSIPIRPNDHIYCTRLSNDAVHTAMRGYSGVCVGAIHNVVAMVPSKFVAGGKRKVNLTSSNWQLAVACTNMPASLSGLKCTA
jgi:6-phosphofructokinase 1